MCESITVKLQFTPDAPDAAKAVPRYATPQSSGVDLTAAIEGELKHGERMVIPTGVQIAVPPGYEAQVRSRSGLALNYGVCVLNSPGTIDADYRGEIKVILINHGYDVFRFTVGSRIAQLVFAPVCQAVWQIVDGLDETQRGTGGFGSTGV